MEGNPQEIVRIRDPIHDLIALDLKVERDALAWKLVNSREFQRLRRIKQLGFSELVFPGATHTRFSHCLGAYFIARKLFEVMRRKVQQFDPEKATIAALLHDLGHGPYSHVFEGVQKGLGRKRSHEEWTADIIEGESEVHDRMEKHDACLASRVATLLRRKDEDPGAFQKILIGFPGGGGKSEDLAIRSALVSSLSSKYSTLPSVRAVIGSGVRGFSAGVRPALL